MYKGVDRDMIDTTGSRCELVKLRSVIRKIDPEAFINVIDSSEILGKGFKKKKKN